MLSIDIKFILDEEKLPFLTCRPSSLAPYGERLVCPKQVAALFPFLVLVL